jgi:hypothetical protein
VLQYQNEFGIRWAAEKDETQTVEFFRQDYAKLQELSVQQEEQIRLLKEENKKKDSKILSHLFTIVYAYVNFVL